MSNATVDLLLDNLRAKLTGATDDLIKLELFNTADEVAREALRVAAPADPAGDPADWLPSDQWVPNYQPLLDGTLARMYAQANRPWASPDLAKVHMDRYMVLLQLARSEAAGSPTTIYERILSNLRAQIPLARDADFRLEIYNTIDKIRREALRLPPLTDTDTDPADWLPADKWDDAYLAILHGTLFRLFSQTAKPWTNPDYAKAQYILYSQELELLRGEEASAASRDWHRLMDMARIRLPGARDNVIQLEFAATLDEFFQGTNVWLEEIEATVRPGQMKVELYPTGPAAIVRLISVADSDGFQVRATMPIIGELHLRSPVSKPQIYRATVSLASEGTADRDGFPFVPRWVLGLYANDLMDGLLGRMMSQLAKPYTNERMAVFHMRKFNDAIARIRVEARHQNTFAAQRWRFPQSFATRRM
jgi:hypothetical protein